MYGRMGSVRSVLVFAAILLTGCAAAEQPSPNQPAVVQPEAGQQAGLPQVAEMAPEARAYLDELLALMEKNSINRFALDWADLRARVYAKAPGAKTIEDTRPAISEALELLNDNHSNYQPKAGSVIAHVKCS